LLGKKKKKKELFNVKKQSTKIFFKNKQIHLKKHFSFVATRFLFGLLIF
jgi:hypothetical protein